MKTIYLLLIVSLITISSFAQSTVESALRFDFYNNLYYNPPKGTHAQAGPDYGCLSSFTNRPVWFYFTVCGADSGATYPMVSINWHSLPFSAQAGLIIWGPFDDTINIASKLTASKIDTCFIHTAPNGDFVPLRHLQYPAFYYGMLACDDTVLFSSMNRLWTGDWWLDDRCGICNSRVANYKQDICMVTLDTVTTKNMIIWDKKYNFQVESFNIYREGTIAGQFDSIGNVPFTSNGMFIDQAVNPNQKSYKYRISGRDSCGAIALTYNDNSFPDSAIVHQTIHMQASPGLFGEVNLAWNAYVGFPYSTFYIYRGSSINNLQILDSVSATTYSYTDYSAPTGLSFYKVTVRNPNGCSPDGGATIYFQRGRTILMLMWLVLMNWFIRHPYRSQPNNRPHQHHFR